MSIAKQIKKLQTDLKNNEKYVLSVKSEIENLKLLKKYKFKDLHTFYHPSLSIERYFSTDLNFFKNQKNYIEYPTINTYSSDNLNIFIYTDLDESNKLYLGNIGKASEYLDELATTYSIVSKYHMTNINNDDTHYLIVNDFSKYINLFDKKTIADLKIKIGDNILKQIQNHKKDYGTDNIYIDKNSYFQDVIQNLHFT